MIDKLNIKLNLLEHVKIILTHNTTEKGKESGYMCVCNHVIGQDVFQTAVNQTDPEPKSDWIYSSNTLTHMNHTQCLLNYVCRY